MRTHWSVRVTPLGTEILKKGVFRDDLLERDIGCHMKRQNTEHKNKGSTSISQKATIYSQGQLRNFY